MAYRCLVDTIVDTSIPRAVPLTEVVDALNQHTKFIRWLTNNETLQDFKLQKNCDIFGRQIKPGATVVQYPNFKGQVISISDDDLVQIQVGDELHNVACRKVMLYAEP